MTTIEEMDEFFNFDEAAHQLVQNGIDFSSLESGPYDIDLAFAEPENDENSFTCLQLLRPGRATLHVRSGFLRGHHYDGPG